MPQTPFSRITNAQLERNRRQRYEEYRAIVLNAESRQNRMFDVVPGVGRGAGATRGKKNRKGDPPIFDF